MLYFPVSVAITGLFLLILIALVILAQIGLLSHVYTSLGLRPTTVVLVLFGSLIGSYVNLPLARLPAQQVISREVVEIMGVPFLAPVAVDWPGTVIAINVGGAVIPILLSFYLLTRYSLWGPGLVAVAVVALIVHQLAKPVPGMGISVPTSDSPAARRLRRARAFASACGSARLHRRGNRRSGRG